eukprot:TRINITY_DN8122_c0_g2_i2.p1 TRINITY_DN8122_c0_g2~~TRINITY_DN8122_c0_g2_i2.p1  ORF type:complete len:299 (+),score=11.37 TRINITY_DN8122_c0_g2_i2:112-1008(+)
MKRLFQKLLKHNISKKVEYGETLASPRSISGTSSAKIISDISETGLEQTTVVNIRQGVHRYSTAYEGIDTVQDFQLESMLLKREEVFGRIYGAMDKLDTIIETFKFEEVDYGPRLELEQYIMADWRLSDCNNDSNHNSTVSSATYVNSTLQSATQDQSLENLIMDVELPQHLEQTAEEEDQKPAQITRRKSSKKEKLARLSRTSTQTNDNLRKSAGLYSKSRKELMKKFQAITHSSKIGRQLTSTEETSTVPSVNKLVQKGKQQQQRIQKIKAKKSMIDESRQRIQQITKILQKKREI